MLIYNFQKEFIGIDEKDLISLGYKSLSELKTEVSDFADLFVKTPGYIHNFKHVHWIDFITCAESYEESRVIINVNNKNYKANITISTAFLMDNPSQKAYLINLNNLRELTHKESESIANDIIERPTNLSTKEPSNIFNTPEFSEDFNEPAEETIVQHVKKDPYAPIEVEENEPIEIEAKEELFIDNDTPIDIDMDIKMDVNMVEDVVSIDPIENIQEESSYIFDPSLASHELGLPLDLIEEFIQDFITQAREFKQQIYTALENADLDNVKILSHKLKGVAANLRVEDALERLTLINTSSDINIIRDNLDSFYIIIAKLAGEKIQQTVEIQEEVSLEFKNDEDDDDDDDDLYSDPIIEDSDVPEKIDIIELADDTFVSDIETPLDIIEDDIAEELEIIPTPQRETIHYSKSAIANEIGLAPESFNSLFDDYLQDGQTLVESMKSAIKGDDFKTSQAEALKLNGMSDNMRIKSFSSELGIIMHSTDKLEIAEAINNIEADFAQLSKLGV